jgi:hypothetical protein
LNVRQFDWARGKKRKRKSAQGAQESIERCVRPLRVRMCEIVPAECDDLSIAFHSGKVIFVTVVTKESLHEPCFGMTRIYVENPIEKNLGDVPSFLGDCAGDVTPVHANHRVVASGLVNGVRLEETDREHACHEKDDESRKTCQAFSHLC